MHTPLYAATHTGTVSTTTKETICMLSYDCLLWAMHAHNYTHDDNSDDKLTGLGTIASRIQ